MSEIPTANTALEQALFQCTLRERRSRRVLLFALLIPLAAAAVWLVYSSAQVGRWQLLGREMRQTQADREKLEAEMESRAAAAEATRKKLEQQLQASQSESRDANARIAELEDILRRIQGEIDTMESSLTGLTGAKWHASLQPKSGNTEAAIVENRALLGKGFAEVEKHLGQALPKEKRAPRLWIYYRDDEQNALVASIKSLMEGEGAVVVSTLKQNFGRQEAHEVVCFRAVDRSQAEDFAKKLRSLEGLGETTVEVDDSLSDLGSGGRFEIWLLRN